MLVAVLNDGDTFTGLQGCIVADVPDDVEDIESFLKENNYDHLLLTELFDDLGKENLTLELRKKIKPFIRS